MHCLKIFIKNVLFFTLIVAVSALISCGSFENKQENKRDVPESNVGESGEMEEYPLEMVYASNMTAILISDISPDGRHLLLYSGMDMQIYDTFTEQIIRRIPIEREDPPVLSRGGFIYSGAVFIGDGTKIGTLTKNSGTVSIWDARTGKIVNSYRMKQMPIVDSTLAGGEILFTLSQTEEGTQIINATNIFSGEFYGSYVLNEEAAGIVISPDLEYICISWKSDKAVSLLKLPALEKNAAPLLLRENSLFQTEKPRDDSLPVYPAVFSADSSMIALGQGANANREAEITVVKVKSGEIKKKMTGHTRIVSQLSFSPDNASLLSTGFGNSMYDGAVLIWDIESGELLHNIHHNIAIVSAVFHDGVKYVYFIDTKNNFYKCDIEGGITDKSHYGFRDSSTTGTGIAISRDNKKLAVGMGNGNLFVWDLQKGKSTALDVKNSGGVTDVQFSSGGDTLATLSRYTPLDKEGKQLLSERDNAIYLWDVNAEELISKIRHPDAELIQHLALTPDGGKVLFTNSSDLIYVYDTATENLVHVLDGHYEFIETIAVSEDSQFAASSSRDGSINVWELKTGEIVSTFIDYSGRPTRLLFSPDGAYLFCQSGGPVPGDPAAFSVWETATNKEIPIEALIGAKANKIYFANNGKYIISLENGDLHVRETGEKEIVFSIKPTLKTVNLLYSGDLTYDGKNHKALRVWTTPIDNAPGFIDLKTGHEIRFINDTGDTSNWLIRSDDGYWSASKRGGKLATMVRGLESWNIDQFAVRNNRPDIILKRLCVDDKDMIHHYYLQYEKRLSRLGIDERYLRDEYHVPDAKIVSYTVDEKTAKLTLFFSDSKYNLKKYQIYVNDVPVFTENEGKVSGSSLTVESEVEISRGHNKIEVSCINETGEESFREVIYVNHNSPVTRNLYYVGIGVSDYRDDDLDLQYAHKDAEDLGQLFGSENVEYQNVFTRILTDEEAARENIAEIKKFLQNATVDDTVVFMISGHGLHDRDKYATYYFLTHEANLDNLSETAVKYEELEEYLLETPARQKLFLMDTCGSGEWDPEIVRKVVSARLDSKGVRARIAGVGSDTEISSELQEELFLSHKNDRTYLADKDRYIYNDLLRRSGSIVFSSCRGDEVSYETNKYTNGIFTEYILRAFTPAKDAGEIQAGDFNGDGRVSTQELQKYVIEGVSKETAGNPHLYPMPQNPTVDRDNIYVEFGF